MAASTVAATARRAVSDSVFGIRALALLALLLSFCSPMVQAQLVRTPFAVENTAFKAGEHVEYELFFDWGIIWKKVGTASLITTAASHNGQDGFDIRLLSGTNKSADLFFKLRDTLQCSITENLEPLYYKKAAEESDHYSVDQAWYSYEGGNASVKMLRTRPDREPLHTSHTDSRCIYDMLSIIARTRNYDLSRFAKGHKMALPLATGRRVDEVTLEYLGPETIKAKNSVSYRCKGFSIYTYDKESKKSKEMLRFYVTDDDNHLPVRIDFYLKIGSAKAYLSGVSGNRHTLSSVVKR